MRSAASGVRGVLENDLCSGCGLCALLDSRISIEHDTRGYARPQINAGPERDPDAERRAASRFAQSCPGVVVQAPRTPAPTSTSECFGDAYSVWRAWSNDPVTRRNGSSGGTLTALASWLLRTQRVESVATVRQDPANALRSAPTTATSPTEVATTAGSRYAPVATLSNPEVVNPRTAVISKPCEASALRAYFSALDAEPPLLLSFFCAGVPSQLSTDGLVAALGLGDAEIASVRYRGDGWPGDFAVTDTGGQRATMSYNESWGQALGPTTQWRCKLCVDGVGRAADITAGDLWETDAVGSPVFQEGEGVSVLIARTPRGHQLLLEAVEDGVINATPASLVDLEPVQPLQVERYRSLAGRLLGVRVAGRAVPRYPGYGLAKTALRRPYKNARAAAGTFRRIRSSRTTSR